jgi:hypothetical protein
MKKNKILVLGMLVMVLACSMVFVGCGDGAGGGDGGGVDWNGDYGEDNYLMNSTINGKATVDLSAKTITGAGAGTTSTSDDFGAIPDVSISDPTDVSWGSSSLKHTGTWVYIYSGDKKIGVLYTWTMSMTGYSETDCSIDIGHDAMYSAYSIAANTMDLSDVDKTWRFSGEKI